MDFNTLLYQAQKNNTKDREVKYYKASLDPPKNETKETRQLSAGSIKRFLTQKEAEDKRKRLEEQKKKEKLTLLRSQDKKSSKRVQSMLNRTKSANKAVLEDAKDDVNTAITTAGFNQPDEDDYGYVSQYTMDIYNNIMEKYANTPADPRSTKVVNNKNYDISGTKDRVKAALLKVETKNVLSHERKRKPKDKKCGDVHQKKSKTDFSTEKIKRRPLPPPSYQELLKIAEKVQHEPVIIGKKESLPLMTEKEKKRYLERNRMEANRNARRQNIPTPVNKSNKLPPNNNN